MKLPLADSQFGCIQQSKIHNRRQHYVVFQELVLSLVKQVKRNAFHRLVGAVLLL